MAKYTPKVNDPVFLDGKGFVRYVVLGIDSQAETATVRTTSGPVVLYRDVPWAKIFELDESQNALRIVREATENKS
jgi:hypothetical protein